MSLFIGSSTIVKATVAASSSYNTNYPATEAFNGNTGDRENDRWVSANNYNESTGYPDSGAGDWYQFEFEGPKRIEKIRVYTGIYPENAPKKITFYVSPTGNFNGEEINCGTVEFSDIPLANNLTDWYEVPNPKESKYFRIVINKIWPSSNGYVIIPEWQLWDSDETSNENEFGDSAYSPTNAFDNNLAEGNANDGAWYAHTSANGYQSYGKIGQNFNHQPKVIKKYRIYSNISSSDYNPEDWTFEGSNDSTNGLSDGTWVVLDTQTGMSIKLGAGIWSDFSIPNNKSFKYYRLNITANGGGGYLIIQDIEMLSYNSDLTDVILNHYTDSASDATFMSDNDLSTYIQNFTYLAIELSVPRKVHRLRIGMYSSLSKTELIGKEFQGSNDSTNGSDGTWETLLTFTSKNLGSVQSIPKFSNLMDVEKTGLYKWYRITGNANNNNVVTQWELFDDPFNLDISNNVSLILKEDYIDSRLDNFPLPIKLNNFISSFDDKTRIFFIDEDFKGDTLDNSIWDTFIQSNASIAVSDKLELNNISGDNHSGAKIFTRDRFNTSGKYRLTFNWKPHTNHYSSAAMPGICFCSPTASRESDYGERQTGFIKCFLAKQQDTTERTELSIYTNDNSSNTWHGSEQSTQSIDIDESIYHPIIIEIDWDEKSVSFSIDNNSYSLSATIPDTVLTAIQDQFVLEIFTSDYNRNNTEIFKDVKFSRYVNSKKKILVTTDMTDIYTKLLIHSDSPTESTIFKDSSDRDRIISKYGDIKHKIDKFKLGLSSIYFDGDGDYLTVADDEDFDLSSGDWTIDLWLYNTSLTSDNQNILNKDGEASTTYPQYALQISSSGNLEISLSDLSTSISTYTISAISLNVWYHVAIVMKDGVLYGFLNGELKLTESSPQSMVNGSLPLYIGYQKGQPTDVYFNGYLDEIRVSKGIARWTSDFTVPNNPYSTDYKCPIEIECWDENNKTIHTKIPIITPSKTNKIKVYFDFDQSDNLDYVGEEGSDIAKSVWDDNFTIIQHMAQDPSGTAPQIKDSTGNGYDSSSAGAMTSDDLLNSSIGKSLDLDGSDDYLTIPDDPLWDIGTSDFTIEIEANLDIVVRGTLFSLDSYDVGIMAYLWDPCRVDVYIVNSSIARPLTLVVGKNFNLTIKRVGGVVKVYQDGLKVGDDATLDGSISTTQGWRIGYGFAGSANKIVDGRLIEFRTSIGYARSESWIKASSAALNSNLLIKSFDITNASNEDFLKVDCNKIDTDLSNFPVSLNLEPLLPKLYSDLLSNKLKLSVQQQPTDEFSGNKLYVGEGGYSSVSDAISAASDGDEICISPGSYPAILVTKHVHLRGLGNSGDVYIKIYSDSPAIRFSSGLSSATWYKSQKILHVTNISFRNTKNWRHSFDAADLQDSEIKILFHKCKILGGSDIYPIDYVNTNVTTQFYNCLITKGYSHIHEYDNGVIDFIKCQLDENVTYYQSSLTLNISDYVIGDNIDYGPSYNEYPRSYYEQSFVEIERWDAIQQVLHIKFSYLSSLNNTFFKLFWDDTLDDNIEYIGEINSIPSQKVWDDNFIAVYHMAQDPSGIAPQILDSTKNNRDGTSSGSMTSDDLIDCDLGKAINFDGNNDLINLGFKSAGLSEVSIEVKAISSVSGSSFVSDGKHWTDIVALDFRTDDIYVVSTSGTISHLSIDAHLSALYSMTYRIVGDLKYFINGVENQSIEVNTTGSIKDNGYNLLIGATHYPHYLSGSISEVRLSKIARSSSWIKATNASLNKSLILPKIEVTKRDIIHMLKTKGIINSNSYLILGGI